MNVWLLAAAAPLAFYAYVAHLVRNPDVTLAYSAYFIERSSDVSPEIVKDRIAALEPVAIGRTYRHDAPNVVHVGWSHPEPDHVWTVGSQAELTFLLPEEVGDTRIEAVLQGFYLNGAQRVVVRRGDTLIDRVFREGDDIVVPLGRQAASQPVTLHLQLPDAARPDNGDRRVLGFALRSYTLRPVSE